MTQSKPQFVKRDAMVGGAEYARLLNSLKERFRRSQIKAAVKVNVSMLEFYWEMGRDICRLHALSQWGKAFFDCLSLDLKAEFPEHTGFSVTNLKYIKRWYEFYNQEGINRQQHIDEIRHQLGDELEMPVDFGMVPWKHHVCIFSHCKSVPEALFYIGKTIQNGWSRSELANEIDANLYGKQGNAVTNFEEKLPAPYSGLAKAILKYQLQKTISEEVAKLLPSEKEIQKMLDTYGKE